MFAKLFGLKGSKDTFIKAIDHVAIVVSDMDRSITYYIETLGLRLLHDGRNEGGTKKTFLGTKSRTLVALTEDKNRTHHAASVVESVGHVAFLVGDVEKAADMLRAKGVEFIEEKIDKTGMKAYHFLDPDGLELEIYGESKEPVPPY